MEKRKILDYSIKLFWIFMIGSIIGYIVEMIVALVQKGTFESRQGLLYGPFAQVYGIGAVFYYLTLPKIKGNGKVFLFSMIVGGIVEYLCSYFQQKYFGTISWDYSNLWFNINGRTSLLHCIYWGTFGVLFVQFVYPLIEKINPFLSRTYFKCASFLLILFMIFNITISCLAADRQKERMQNIAAENSIDVFLDHHYPDYIMNRIYANKINTIPHK